MKAKRLFGFVLVCVFMLSAPAISSDDDQMQPFEKVVKQLGKAAESFKVPLKSWKYTKRECLNCLDIDFRPSPKEGWKRGGVGYVFRNKGEKTWFWKIITVPEQVEGIDVAGSQLMIYAHMESDGEIYVNGKFQQAFRSDKGQALVAKNVQPGEEYVIVLMGVNRREGSLGLFADAYLVYTATQKVQQATNDYIHKVSTVKFFMEDQEDQRKWIDLFNKSASMVDLEAKERKDYDRYLASLDAANAELLPFREITKDYKMYLLGYSHIDLAWLWDYEEGEQVWYDTSRTIFNLMEEYPDFTFTETQAHGYKWMEDDYPEVFDGLKKWFKTGRWEITGGTWSEYDSNIPCGESFVRQSLYGKRYFREKFGKDVVVAWTPDSFGYNWNLPQILRKSGMIGFLTQKINWNDTTRFPHHIFWWEGADGTRLLTYFPVGGYGESVEPHRMLMQMQRIKSKHGVNENFVIFGVGDHGGGVTRGHLNRAFALRENDIYPEVVFTTAEDYFKHLHELSKDHEFPVWSDELYLEYHRGTYTSQANTKNNNRRGEALLMNAEKFASIANLIDGAEYPFDRIFDGWYILMLNHMHDILPGSGINKVYKDADRDYARLMETENGVMREAMGAIEKRIDTRGDGQPVVVFNPLSWERTDAVEIPLDQLGGNTAVTAPDGSLVPSQVVENEGGKRLLFMAKVPAVGYAVYRVAKETAGEKWENPSLSASSSSLENEFLKVTVDPSAGEVTSVYDKRHDRELYEPGRDGNRIQIYDDNPARYDAWNIKIGDERYLDRVGDVEVVESGPVRATILVKKQTNISKFRHFLSLYSGVPQFVGRLDVKWQERNTIAKLAFPLNLTSETAWFEIPYAAIERRSIPRTLADQAKWEVSAQKWVDYTDESGEFGVSLLNYNKYGYDVKNNVLRMTLLRSPIAPDPLCDRGRHVIPYSLYPHEGDWRAADTPRRGYEFNYPLIPVVAEAHRGKLPKEKSFFASEPSNIILSAVKKAEDGDAFILRFVETTGKDSNAIIRLPRKAKRAAETNLLEEEIAEVKLAGDTIAMPIGRFEIKSVKVEF